MKASRSLAVIVSSLFIGSVAQAQVSSCVGDCDGDGKVEIHELVIGIRIALDRESIDDCPSFDVDGDGGGGISELLTAVNNALRRCRFFAPPSLYPEGGRLDVGEEPLSLAVADLDGDSVPDLVTANWRSSDVSVLLGAGDGSSFAAEQRYSVGGRLPNSVAVADLNSDGAPDLVTTNDGDVSVLLGRGNGTFGAEQRYDTGGPPRSVAVVDLDGDGTLDLVAANTSIPLWVRGNVGVLLGAGDGTFSTVESYDLGSHVGPPKVEVTDLDGDSVPDLVIANSGSSDVSVLLGMGDGTFAPEQVYGVSSSPNSVEVADLDGDSVPDLVTANRDSSDVSVLLGMGDGTFAPEQVYGVSSSPNSVEVADLDGDSVPDLVTANSGSSDVSVLLGAGDGSFAPEQRYSLERGSHFVAAVDLNSDGAPDLVTTNAGGVSVLLGKGDGTFAAEQRYDGVWGPGSGLVAIVDLNRDDVPDLVNANARANNVSVILGVGDGTFPSGRAHRGYDTGDSPVSVAVADFNGDGLPDLVTTNYDEGDVSVLFGLGDATFATEQRYGAGDSPASVAVADLNGDGLPDLVTANQGSDDVYVLLQASDGVFVNPGQRFSVGISPASVAVADLNGDGLLDLVTANGDSPNREDFDDLSVLLGAGDGTFGPQQLLDLGDGYRNAVVVADLNGDQVPDLVTTRDCSATVLLGEGEGLFAAEQQYGRGPVGYCEAFAIAVADLNGDHVPDLVIADNASMSVLLGVGDGTFPAEKRYFIRGRGKHRSVAVADLNGDGLPDLVTANEFSRDVSVLLGGGDGSFPTEQRYRVTGDSPQSVAVADFNGDGLPDLVTANRRSSDVSVLLALPGSVQLPSESR